MNIIERFFPSKTRAEHVIDKTEKVFTLLTNDLDCDFTDLEVVQILNNTRRKLSSHLKEKKSESMEQSVNFNQKASEIDLALKYIDR